ncbi:hypothetical protein [Saccharibacillus deserti]|uniref:hypothetical protein n=1 Tax=Saccharibacillus deserti TaxID=1634444 RepID=UPI001554A8D6|nr:hypothetical protein [Saccharibacillus deserti]
MHRSKKIFSIILSFLILFAASAVVPEQAGARRGGFSTGQRTYTGTPNKSQNTDSVHSGMRSNSNPYSHSGYTRARANHRGIFGGTFFRGLFFGGAAVRANGIDVTEPYHTPSSPGLSASK